MRLRRRALRGHHRPCRRRHRIARSPIRRRTPDAATGARRAATRPPQDMQGHTPGWMLFLADYRVRSQGWMPYSRSRAQRSIPRQRRCQQCGSAEPLPLGVWQRLPRRPARADAIRPKSKPSGAKRATGCLRPGTPVSSGRRQECWQPSRGPMPPSANSCRTALAARFLRPFAGCRAHRIRTPPRAPRREGEFPVMRSTNRR